MDRYLIAVDMDGTLLNSRNEISAYTLNALKKIQEKGHLIVPASGRCLALLPPEIRNFDGLAYAVAENGAFIWDFKKRTPLFQKLLPEPELMQILEQVRDLPCFVEVFAEGRAYARKQALLRLNHTVQTENFIRYFSKDHVYVDSLEETPEILKAAGKINLYFEDEEVGKRFKEIWQQEKKLAITTSVGDNVEMTAAGVNKGTAIRFLMEKLEIPQSRVLVFGDNENDLEMFETAGCAVAMANAAESIQKRADHTTLDCDHDGVAVFLEKYF